MKFDDKTKLAMFNNMPMPIWACDRDCVIRYWNDGAVTLYGYSKEEAVGKDFVTLFVNQAEQDQARIDIIKIIDGGEIIRNMADDKDKFGNTINLVTHCFRVKGVAEFGGLQVEVSYQVQDIERLSKELKVLQEQFDDAKKHNAELEKQIIIVTRDRAFEALKASICLVRDSVSNRENALLTQKMSSKTFDTEIAKDIEDLLNRERDKLLQREEKYRRLIGKASTVKKLEALIRRIEKRED